MRIASAVAIVALVLTGCAARSQGAGPGHHTRASSEPQSVPLATASYSTVRPSESIAGVIAPFQNVSISSSLPELADSVNVNEGDSVRRGESLAVLDTADLRANLEAANRAAASADARVTQIRYQANLNIGQGSDQVMSARAALLQARANLHQAQIDLARDEQLVVNGYIPQQTLDQQRTVVQNDEQQVLSAEANLRSAITNERVNGTDRQGLQAANIAAAQADAQSAHAQVRQIQAQIDKAIIFSPVDGVVVNRNLNPGEYPGSRTVLTIQALSTVYAELNASSQDVFRVRTGAPVTLSIPGAAGFSSRGSVVAVLGQVQPGSTNFTVKVLFANPDVRLKSGMAISGTVALPPISGVAIPTTAFLNDEHDTVMIVTANRRARTVRVVELGNDGKTSIVRGLTPGTRVIANGQLGISDGEQVSYR